MSSKFWTIGSALEKVVIGFGFVFYGVLSFVTLLVSAHLLDSYSVTILYDRWWIVLLGVVLVFIIIVFLFKLMQRLKVDTKTILIFGSVYSAIFGCLWVAFSNVWPEWDPLYILLGAQGVNDTSYVPTCPGTEMDWVLCSGGYFERFPYQIPMLVFDWVLVSIFGSGAYLAFEFINVFCVVGVLITIAYYTHVLFHNRVYTNMSVVLVCGFIPLYLYTTFAYGNTLCLPFVFLSLAFQKKYFDTRKYRYAVCSGITILIAVLLKSTMIYILLAEVVIFLIHAVKNRSFRSLLSLLIVVVCYLPYSSIISVMASGFNLSSNKGMPSTVWIAMGIDVQTDKQSSNFGWYNGYPTSWEPENYDLDTISKDAEQSIRESLEYYASNPSYVIKHFGTKFLSEWTEPTYESFLASYWGSSGHNRPIMSERKMSRIQRSVYSGKLRDVLESFMDVFQSLLTIGSFVFIFFSRRKLSIEHMGSIIIPVGVCLLYLVWEAQSQYIMPAYLVMIPFCAGGIMVMSKRVTEMTKNHKKRFR